LPFLFTDVPATQVRENIRTVDLTARSSSPERLDLLKLGDLTLTNHDGCMIPLSQIGHGEMRPEDPILRRRDRVPTIAVESDINEALQPPQVSTEIKQALQPIITRSPDGYRIEMGGNIAACPTGGPDRARGGAGLHPGYLVNVLGSMADTLIGGRRQALCSFWYSCPRPYKIWYRIKPPHDANTVQASVPPFWQRARRRNPFAVRPTT
jgi:hypothetical protein